MQGQSTTITLDDIRSQVENSSGGSILDNAVCVSIELCSIGARKKIKPEEAAIMPRAEMHQGGDDPAEEADKEWVSASKRLIKSDAYDAIRKIDSQIRGYVSKVCLPSMFRAGVYLVPVKMVEEVDRQLSKLQDEREAAVKAFCDVYENEVAAAKTRLGALFNQDDYPSADTLGAKFGFVWQYIAFSAPEALRGIKKEMFERERNKAAAQLRSATEEIRLLLRQTMLDLTNGLVERLTIGEDGKKKRLRVDSLGAITEFLGTIDMRNITGDDELQEITDKAKAILGGCDIDALKNQEQVRAQVLGGFQQIQETLGGLVENRPSRAITFEEE